MGWKACLFDIFGRAGTAYKHHRRKSNLWPLTRDASTCADAPGTNESFEWMPASAGMTSEGPWHSQPRTMPCPLHWKRAEMPDGT
jgi:hypothetical protein